MLNRNLSFAGAAGERVVAGHALEVVVAAQALEHVEPGIADDGLRVAVAGEVDRVHAVVVGRGQRFHLLAGGQLIVDRRAHGVAALAGGLVDVVAGVVDVVGVVAAKAAHDVGAAFAIEDVGASVADERIDDAVAGEIDGCRPCIVGRPQGLDADAIGKLIAEARLDGVAACICGFDHDVAGTVDDVCVVAEPTDHGVIAGSAIERVVAVFAMERVVVVQADSVSLLLPPNRVSSPP